MEKDNLKKMIVSLQGKSLTECQNGNKLESVLFAKQALETTKLFQDICDMSDELRQQIKDEEEKRKKRSLPVLVGTDAHQEPIIIDMEKIGCVIIYGSPGYGKTTLCRTIMAGMYGSAGNTMEYYVLNSNASEEYADIQHEMMPNSYQSIKEMAEMVSLMENEINDRYAALYELGKKDAKACSSTWQDIEKKRLYFFIDPLKQLDEKLKNRFEEVSRVIGHTGSIIGLHLILTTQWPSIIPLQTRLSAQARIMLRLLRPNDEIIFDYHEKAQAYGSHLKLGEFMIAQNTMPPIIGRFQSKTQNY